MLELRSVSKDKQLQEVTRISRGLTRCLIWRIAPSSNSAIFQEIYNYNKIIMILFPKPADVFIQLWVICLGYLFYHCFTIYIYIISPRLVFEAAVDYWHH